MPATGDSHVKGNMKIAGSLLSLLGLLGLTVSQSTSFLPTGCSDGVSARNVSSTAEALELSDALLCSGPGQFEVQWSGEVLLTKTLVISNGHSLKISGRGEDATIDGSGALRLFEVMNGSTLELDRVSLVRGGLENDGSALEDGGAVFVSENSRLAAKDCSFGYNNAMFDGGAIESRDAFCSMNGNVTFTNNTAGRGGGAIYSYNSIITINGDTYFANNSAGSDGGALSVERESSLTLSGSVAFLHNTAQENGGAITVRDSTIVAEPATLFSGNKAIKGAGGGAYVSISTASINGANFTTNEAGWGGGLALFSAGSVWNTKSPDDSGPANTTRCVFERNKATDGGAIYSAAGYDIIEDSQFDGNLAVGSGGAYLHSGVLVSLHLSDFTENRAGLAGPAVSSLGMVEGITNTSFEANTYFCASGAYGYDIASSRAQGSDTCRFGVVCSGCAVSCEDLHGSVTVLNDSFVPTCETAMKGVDASDVTGMTLSTLNLESGYYRTHAESRDILKCHREEACLGGVDTGHYCETGYRGPYCAVCEEGYAPGYQYSCSSCEDESKRSAMGTSIALLLLALVGVILVILDLIRVVNEDGTVTVSTWGKHLVSCRDRIAKIIPVTSIKIVVVAWQIITQFSSVVNVVYPDVYQRFLSNLNLVNLNIGFILSVSCIVNTNFYHQLIFVTIGPLVVAGVLVATFAVARSRNRHSPTGIQAAKHKHLSIALFIVFVIYSSVSFTIFQTFACETLDNDVDYLRADYSLACSTGTHTAMKAYAGVMILVYPIGIPAFFAWWLISNRHDIVNVGAADSSRDASKSLDHLQPMRDLWAPYQPSRYYFEVVECGRRIVLTGLAVFLSPGTAAQVAIEVVLAAVFIGVSEKLLPFADPLDGWLYRCGTWVVFLTMYLGLLLKVDASDEDSKSQAVFAKVLIAAHVCMNLMVVFQAVLSFRRGILAIRDQPVVGNVSRTPSCEQVCDGPPGDAIKGRAEPVCSKEA